MSFRGFVIGAELILTIAAAAPVARSVEPLSPEEAARYADLEARPLQTFTNVDLADYLWLRSADFAAKGETPNPADEVGRWATKAIGQPYRLGASRFDYSESDCVVATERAIAMALSADWDSYYRLCERLRHKDGQVDFLERNFMTLTQWVPNNAWLLRDITAELGPVTTFPHLAAPKRFYSRLSFGELEDTEVGRAKAVAKAAKVAAAAERIATAETYIAREDIPGVLNKLRTGDVALVMRKFRSSTGDPLIDCDHMGIVAVREDGAVFFAQGAPPRARKEKLLTFQERFDRVAGFKFLRLVDDAKQAVANEARRVTGSAPIPTPERQDATNGAMRARRAAQ
jgi:hypothetical protein